MAGIAHGISVIVHIVFFEVMWLLQGWRWTPALLGMITCMSIQSLLLKIFTIAFLLDEFKQDNSNCAWWSGKWYSAGLGWMTMTQPLREFVCKIVEALTLLQTFVLGHCLLFVQLPLLCIPMIDRWHSMLLFWLRPSRQIRPPIFSLKQNKLRKRMVRKYATLYFGLLLLLLILIIAPAVAGKSMDTSSIIPKNLPDFAKGLVQPTGQDNKYTGDNAPSTVETVTPVISNWSTKP